jgi:Cytochrome P460
MIVPLSTVGAYFRASSVMFPQGSVPDGLSTVATSGGTTRIRFPRPGEVSPSSRRSDKDQTHTTTFGFAYVNDVGRSAFQQKPFRFPAGSIIVRERLPTLTSRPDVLVVMVKHERDFNRKANGWEFLTINGDATKVLKREKQGNCLKCHASAAGNDFVFPEDASQP